MTSFYGMGKRSEDESNITTKLSSRMVKSHSTVRWLTTVAVIFFALTCPSKGKINGYDFRLYLDKIQHINRYIKSTMLSISLK